MDRRARHRFLGGGLDIIALTVGGVLAGCVLGCGVALLEVNHSLEESAEAAAAHENAALGEARGVLRAMQGSRAGFCSDGEIGNLRLLVFGAEYVKDAGRIRGGRIECSAMLGHPARAVGPFKADFRLKDGTLAYRDLSSMQVTGVGRAALRQGSAYAVLGVEPLVTPGSVSSKLGIQLQVHDLPRAESGATETTDPPYMTVDGSGMRAGALYVTRCSEAGFSCVTAVTSVSESVRGESSVLGAFAIAGGIGGIFLGMGFPFLLAGKQDMGRQLRRAVEDGKLEVHYQPIVNLETREIVGAEALARWTDDEGDEVDPEIFVKVAEEQGFIGSITKTVLKRVLRDFAATLRSRPEFRISINVGAADLLEPKFLPMLEGALEKARVRPESLVVEITERSAANGEAAKETIRLLRQFGHSIHIDDFGSGFSNLDKLLYLYADTIKIDKAFTRTIDTESVAAVILPHMMKIAKSLNLEVIVEGVEIPRQADYFLPGKQRIYGQGFLFGRPMTAAAFLSVLADTPARARASAERNGARESEAGTLQAAPSLTA